MTIQEDIKLPKFIVVEVGRKTSDKRLQKEGVNFEIIDMTGDDEGGPLTLCWCPTMEAAQAIKHAMELAFKLAR